MLVPGGGSRVRAVVVSVAAPALALGLALIVQPERELGAVSLFLLAVVAASVAGGIWAGIGSSLVGFLALNYFFTEPLHTFRVHNRDDVVALVVFLVVALLVGWVVSRAVSERDRATRREREARLLNLFATKALSGEPLERVLNDLAAALVDAASPGRLLDHRHGGRSLVRRPAYEAGHDRGRDGRGADPERRDRVRNPHGLASRSRGVRRRGSPADRGRREPGRGLPGARPPRCGDRRRPAGRGAEPGASSAVLLGDPRPPHAARVDQDRGDEPAAGRTFGSTRGRRGSSCRRSSRRPTG